MRAVQLADIDAAARAVMCCPQSARAQMAAWLIVQADAGDRYRKRLRKAHPRFGTGTLMSVASKYPQSARIDCFDSDALDAFTHVIKALAAQKAHQPL